MSEPQLIISAYIQTEVHCVICSISLLPRNKSSRWKEEVSRKPKQDRRKDAVEKSSVLISNFGGMNGKFWLFFKKFFLEAWRFVC